MKKYTVLIVGGSGLIGQRLKAHFEKLNYNVGILSRKPKSQFYWDPVNKKIDLSILKHIDYIVNLCGSSIDQRWTKKVKKAIYSSRIEATNFLISHINSSPNNIKKYIGISAIGYYDYGKFSQKEDAKTGNHFLSKICASWEAETANIKPSPWCILRLGVVLSKNGGILKKLIFPFSIYLGSILGNGKQKISWVHIDDVCRMIIFCVKTQQEGIFNCVSPNPVSYNVFAKKLADVLEKKIWLPKLPAVLLKIVFGEMSTMILGHSNIDSTKVENAGFKFKFSKIEKALKNLID